MPPFQNAATSNAPSSKPSTTLLSHVNPHSRPHSAKPQGIMAFSPLSRLDRTAGRNDPQTPSKMPRLASPGLPVSTGFALPQPPGSTSVMRAQHGPLEKTSITASKAIVGFSPLQSVVSPLSRLGGIGGGLTAGASSPSSNVAKKRTMRPIGQPVLVATSPSSTALTRGKAQERPLHVGLPAMPNRNEFAMYDEGQSPLGESVGGSADGLSGHDVSPVKGKLNE